MGHAKLPGDLGKIARLALILLRGSARDHFQIGDLCQASENFVLDAIGKVGVRFVLLRFSKGSTAIDFSGITTAAGVGALAEGGAIGWADARKCKIRRGGQGRSDD